VTSTRLLDIWKWNSWRGLALHHENDVGRYLKHAAGT